MKVEVAPLKLILHHLRTRKDITAVAKINTHPTNIEINTPVQVINTPFRVRNTAAVAIVNILYLIKKVQINLKKLNDVVLIN